MNRYLTACDLDDTLLTSRKKIKFRSRLFIKNYIKRGNYFIICTGRPINGCYKYWKKIANNMPIITSNGAVIHYFDGKELKTKYFNIEHKIFKEFLMKVDKYILSGVSFYENEILVQNKKEVPDWIIHKEKNTVIREGQLSKLLNHSPILPNLWIYEEYIEEFIKIIDNYSEHFSYRNWGLYNGRYSIEIFSINASKGNAMLFLAKQLNVSQKNVCAFGDQLNDLSMLEMANYGVAMINSREEVKQACKYVTKHDFNHNGVINFLIEHKLF